jgi:hypothetical protein
MFDEKDIDIDERTEGSEWTLNVTSPNFSDMRLDLVNFGDMYQFNNTDKVQYKAYLYQADAFVGTVYTTITVPQIVTNNDTFLQWGMYILRRAAARRHMQAMSPTEFEMLFNLMNELVDEEFKAVTSL